MQFADINIDALQRATDFVVGPDGTAQIAKGYHSFAAAMQAAYNEGFLAGRTDAEANVEERLDNAFDEGFEQGAAFQELEDEADTEQTAVECYDDGYLEGVQEALDSPGYAYNKMLDIVHARAAQHYEALQDALAEPEEDEVCGVCGSSHCECGPEDDERLYDEA